MIAGLHALSLAMREFACMQEVRKLSTVSSFFVTEEIRLPCALCFVHGSCDVTERYLEQLLQGRAFFMGDEEMQLSFLREFLEAVFPLGLRVLYEESYAGMKCCTRLQEDSDGEVFVKQVHSYLCGRIWSDMSSYRTWWDSDTDSDPIYLHLQSTACECKLGTRQLHYLQIHQEALDSSNQYLEVSLVNVGMQFTIDGLREFMSSHEIRLDRISYCAMRMCNLGSRLAVINQNLSEVKPLREAQNIRLEAAVDEGELGFQVRICRYGSQCVLCSFDFCLCSFFLSI